MSITVNSNPSASVASLHLSRNNTHLRKSIARLSSGQRVEKPSDDAGGMAVAMKLEILNRLERPILTMLSLEIEETASNCDET